MSKPRLTTMDTRIYVILPKTVQSPLEPKQRRGRTIMTANKLTKTTVQPVGRMGAQIAHVTSIMRLTRFTEHVLTMKPTFDGSPTDVDHWLRSQLLEMDGPSGSFVHEAITTLIFSVPDSLWLEHIQSLLRAKKIRTFEFIDTNPEYGGGAAKTAICTLPIDPVKMDGIVDYLPLWVHP